MILPFLTRDIAIVMFLVIFYSKRNVVEVNYLNRLLNKIKLI